MEPLPPAPFAADFNLPEGQELHLSLPLADKLGTARVVVAGGLVLNETRFHPAGPTAAWQHLNERPVVEMNFVLAGTVRQRQSGLPPQPPYAPGDHNWVHNPGSLEENQLLGTGQLRLVTVQVPAPRMAGLLAAYAPELAAVAEQIE